MQHVGEMLQHIIVDKGPDRFGQILKSRTHDNRKVRDQLCSLEIQKHEAKCQ